MVSKAIQKMNEIGYVPPRETWTPVDEALYGDHTLFSLPKEQADELRFKAIKHAFDLYPPICVEQYSVAKRSDNLPPY